MEEKLTQKRLKEVLSYNPKTGIFISKTKRKGSKGIGTEAGNIHIDGHIRIMVDHKNYKAHRLAWFYMNGYFPEYGLDHKDRVRHHNWISNLREASQQCNIRNAGMLSNNTSGVKGVSFDNNSGKWRAIICVSGRNIRFGSHLNKIDAVKARWEAEKKYKFPNCCTTSSSYIYLLENGGF